MNLVAAMIKQLPKGSVVNVFPAFQGKHYVSTENNGGVCNHRIIGSALEFLYECQMRFCHFEKNLNVPYTDIPIIPMFHKEYIKSTVSHNALDNSRYNYFNP
jgi:hypothetical protein